MPVGAAFIFIQIYVIVDLFAFLSLVIGGLVEGLGFGESTEIPTEAEAGIACPFSQSALLLLPQFSQDYFFFFISMCLQSSLAIT